MMNDVNVVPAVQAAGTGSSAAVRPVYGPDPRTFERPWPVSRQFWVALLGGIVPITVIAWINADRLGLSTTRRRLILAIGTVGALLTLGLALVRIEMVPLLVFRHKFRAVQIIARVVGALFYALFALVQRPAERAYRSGGGEPGKLWAPGFMAVAGLGTFQGLVLTVVAALLTL